ncbi:MAG: leucine-rich repeat protein [Lachnospiraceae bacterium]|nr:leucine-rich repeat protein [Lachnospiraceae bacterium]
MYIGTSATLTYDASDGSLPIVVGSSAKISSDGHTLTIPNKSGIAGETDTTVELKSTGNAAFYKMAKLVLDSDGQVYVVASASGSSDNYQDLLSAISSGNNGITIQFSFAAGDSNGTVAAQKTTTVNAFVGGTAAVKGNTYGNTAAFTVDAAGDKNEVALRNGDVYAKLGSSGVEILRGNNSDLDGMDYFRSYTLDLTKVNVTTVATGVALFQDLPVTKIGAQALKKAHMKKFYAENAKTIGKGALRNAKQVKHVDICDSNKVRKIHEKAFMNCKNLNTIIIDGRKLNTVGKNAFSGVKKKATVKIKAKKSKYESDKKMILKNGGNKNLKFVRK